MTWQPMWPSLCPVYSLSTKKWPTGSRLCHIYSVLTSLYVRWRFASRAKIDCADILIARGKFTLARTYLRSAVTHTPISPSVITPLVTSQLALHSSHSNAQWSGDSLSYWSHLRVWTLRKSLLCARSTNNRSDYTSISLALLEPSLSRYIPDSLKTVLQNDVMSNCQLFSLSPSFFSSDTAPHLTPLPEVLSPKNSPTLVVTADQHFKFTILMSSSAEHGDEESSQCASIPVTSTTKHIHDEAFPVSGLYSYTHPSPHSQDCLGEAR
jgi:hypothetical protein